MRRSASQRAKRHGEIAAALRRQIIAGTWLANQRLPTHVRLEKRFHTTPLTLQKALRVLREEGFIRSEPGRGLFVASHPPHQHRYALIFEPDPTELEAPPWSRLYAALSNEAAELGRRTGRVIEPFYDIHRRSESKEYQRLVRELASRRFAGLIFVQSPHGLVGTPLMAVDGLPRVAIMTEPKYPHVPAVAIDLGSFLDRALDHLAERQRRRVALICLNQFPGELLDRYATGLQARGLVTQPYWTLRSGLPADGVASWVQLLCHPDLREPPDALIVEDDNLLAPAVAGLIAAGVRVPEDLEVVAHCNFPWAGVQALPLTWLGFDIRQVMRACVDVIDQQQQGRTPPRVTTITAVFEPETSARRPAPSLSDRQPSTNIATEEENV